MIPVANISTQRQARWFPVPMPVSQADELPQHCVIDGKWIATKGPRIADHTQMWHVRADLGGLQPMLLLDWRPYPEGHAFPAFHLSPWVTDSIEKVKLNCSVVTPLGRIELGPKNWEVIFENDACRIWEFDESRDGWHWWVSATTWSHQDVVDLEWQLTWSDAEVDTRMQLDDILVIISAGEPISFYWGKAHGHKRLFPSAIRVYSGPLPHGTPIQGMGVMCCTDDDPSTIEPFAPARTNFLLAATEGPILAAPHWPDGEWLAFGTVPVTHDGPDIAAITNRFDTPGSMWDRRRLALAGNTGQTGAQPPFGATKDSMVLNGRPWRLWELLESALDPRGIHHRSNDGAPITKESNPHFSTWCSVINPHSVDKLGKAYPFPNGWDTVGPRSVMADDQHEGSAFEICAYALTGSRLLRRNLMAKIAVHETRAFARNRWRDAPRAPGRLWQCWAKLAVLFDGHTRHRLNALASAELELWEAYWASQTGEVKALFRINDPRVLPGLEASMPWQDALANLGALEQHYAWARLGDFKLARRFLVFAVNSARSVIRYGSVRTAWGQLLPLTGLELNADGAAKDSSYYTYPRAGAGETQFAGIDMLVGTPGWWSWFAGSIAAVLHGSMLGIQDDDVTATARELWDTLTVEDDREWLEWFAIPVRQEP